MIGVSTNGGSAHATIGNAAASANGRFVDEPLLSWIGEAGPEYVIPVSAGKRARGLDLWMQAGQDLGVFSDVAKNADGGYVANGEESYLRTPFEQKDDNTWLSSEGTGNHESNNTSVNVNLAPVFKIEGKDLDEQKVFSVVKERIRELADDIGDEIAGKLEQAFGNMPVAEGA